jgi:hypothetical protein
MGRAGEGANEEGDSMTTDDLEAFGRVMTLVNEIYGDPNREVSDMKMRWYFHVLGDLTIEEVEGAVFCMSRTRTRHAFPTPGEIREALAETGEGRAEKAFGRLIETIHRSGRYRCPEFEDDIVATTVKALGGWQTVCSWNVEDRQWKRKEFMKVYKACLEQETEGAAPTRLRMAARPRRLV